MNKKSRIRLKNAIAAILIVSGLPILVAGTGLLPLSMFMSPDQSGGILDNYQWTAELTPLTTTTARLTITTNYDADGWVNVRYALENAGANCCSASGVCAPPSGWITQLPQPIGKITAPNTYTYTLTVEEGKPVYVGLWLAGEIDPRTGIPWDDYGNEPYCSGPIPGEFSGGVMSFTSTWHWAFPIYEFIEAVPEPDPTPEPEPVSQPKQDVNYLFVLIGVIMPISGGVVYRYG